MTNEIKINNYFKITNHHLQDLEIKDDEVLLLISDLNPIYFENNKYLFLDRSTIYLIYAKLDSIRKIYDLINKEIKKYIIIFYSECDSSFKNSHFFEEFDQFIFNCIPSNIEVEITRNINEDILIQINKIPK
jgi:hypothetical protein